MPVCKQTYPIKQNAPRKERVFYLYARAPKLDEIRDDGVPKMMGL
ncbi:hypothetical protein OHAE_2216 [Ochrobactrum soli]|uniref:Uncharacterized protein n=1 Tax=Ochrobactrum soli TaxID=2448455 RepID=A0A2P9HQJ4_9HYPH|nr:hypothetical protein OHAE_2216 [[Ochrobactrum] soli]